MASKDRNERADAITLRLEGCMDAIHGAGELIVEGPDQDQAARHAAHSTLELVHAELDRDQDDVASLVS